MHPDHDDDDDHHEYEECRKRVFSQLNEEGQRIVSKFETRKLSAIEDYPAKEGFDPEKFMHNMGVLNAWSLGLVNMIFQITQGLTRATPPTDPRAQAKLEELATTFREHANDKVQYMKKAIPMIHGVAENVQIAMEMTQELLAHLNKDKSVKPNLEGDDDAFLDSLGIARKDVA